MCDVEGEGCDVEGAGLCVMWKGAGLCVMWKAEGCDVEWRSTLTVLYKTKFLTTAGRTAMK